MLGKKYKADMTFLLWCGEKALAGDPLTPEELSRFKRARAQSVGMAMKFFGIKPHEFTYAPGEDFQEPQS